NAGKVLFDRRLTPDEPDYTVSYRYYEQTGYHQKKYINVMSYQNINANDPGKNPVYGIRSFALQLYPQITADVISQSLNNIADLIHIRFADVLLMQSELKGDATGLNRVRARSNLAPIAYSLAAIKNERRWEFAFESIRWWDLLRWSGPSLEEVGEALNKQKGFTLLNAGVEVPMVNFDYKARLKQTQGYWPIPQTEIDLSGGLFEQNPGWESSALFSSWNRLQ
ncbi:MAG: RagB/SusD family nutrient uptake outer membrane protein, partial [Petrimonas sp.]|nr:RagB/SusD family nutrient uptake outer membrane protein [Petrimonas sp.]